MDLKDYVEELTKCTICFCDLFDPKSLPCLHMFCLQCLDQYCQDNCPGDEAKCPICRNTFIIPDQGVEQLRTNFFVKGLTELKHNTGKSPSVNVPCDGCSEGGNAASIIPATMQCTGCDQKLCDRCSVPHGRFPGGGHNIVAFEEDETFCISHGGKKLDSYCIDCQQNICVKCCMNEHEAHHFQTIADIHEGFRETLDSKIELALARESFMQNELNIVEVVKETFADKVQSMKEIIQQLATDLKVCVDAAVDELLQEVDETNMETARETALIKENLQFCIAASQSFTKHSSELLRSGKPQDITRAHKDLLIRAQELLQQDLEVADYSFPSFRITPEDFFTKLGQFIARKRDVYRERCSELRQSHEAEIARIRIDHNLQVELLRSQLQAQNINSCNFAELTYSTDEGKAIDSLTTLGNELYVRYRGDSFLTVYDTATRTAQRNLEIPLLHGDTDMTSCKKHQCVYVSDWNKKVVHKVANKVSISQWKVCDWPRSLSVNSAGNVLVTCALTSGIKEFSTDGELLRVIRLQPDIVNPMHAVEMSSGQFLVCHGRGSDSLHRVCLVDESGRALRSFGTSPGSGSKQLKVPGRLAVNGVILVTDSCNSRVVMLSPMLTYIRDVVVGLRQPTKIHLDEQSGRLYVADNDQRISGHMKVFAI